MKKHLIHILLVLCIAITLVQCAKRGQPTGGPVDEEAPVILRIYPDNFTRNFKNQVIEIQFDEYVKLKDLQKQLVISPPLKTRPIISPQGSPSKKIKIEITDTLKDNTTYVLNFGQSIVDNNEGNPYPFFKYVFSTGPVIDSLKLKGKITDALKFEAEEFVSVMLYEVDENYTDSLIYKESPRYVLNTLDSLTTFTMENLKEGTYKMVALKEENSDLRFDPKRDKIGFVSGTVSVPSDDVQELKLYKQELDPEVKKITQEASTRFYVGYTGNVDSIKVKPVHPSSITKSRLTQLKEKDTLQYWFQPVIDQDSIMMAVNLNQVEDEFKVRLKKLEKDSLTIEKDSKFSLRDPLLITASTPIEQIDNSLISLQDRDSTAIAFQSTIDKFKNNARFDFEKSESQKYLMTLYPGAITDFYGEKNKDTLNYSLNTPASSTLGNILVTISNGDSFPVIIQVVKKDLTIVAEQSLSDNGSHEFLYLPPSDYYLRVVHDTNANGRYDAGNFLKGIQPEKVSYHPELIQLQANWDRRYSLNLE